MTSLQEFRAEVLGFFDGVDALLAGVDGTITRAKAYRAALFDAGLAAVSYPEAIGGRGLGPEFEAELQRLSIGRAPGEDAVFGIGIGMCMPVLRDLASPDLQQRFLRPGLRGEEIWCQLYSEPGAGSDLAGLTTRAELDGDEWIVNGQKVWSSGAQHSDFGILLARTDSDLPKHQGITMFVCPMHQPGVVVRPLVQMTGVAEFNEVFLTDARIPAEWVVGSPNDGWRAAVALLGHERAALGRGTRTDTGRRSKSGRSPLPVDGLLELARARGRAADPLVRQELAALATGELIIPTLARLGVHPSIGKLWRTIQGRRAAQLAHELGGPSATAWDHDDVEADYWAYHVLNCRGMSLGGGTDEIQKNTLGERVLGLPREPGPSRDTPFRDLPRN